MMNLINVDETKHQVIIKVNIINFHRLIVVRISDKKTDITSSNFKIHYTTYKEGGGQNDPLHPRPIVDEYNFAKV